MPEGVEGPFAWVLAYTESDGPDHVVVVDEAFWFLVPKRNAELKVQTGRESDRRVSGVDLHSAVPLGGADGRPANVVTGVVWIA